MRLAGDSHTVQLHNWTVRCPRLLSWCIVNICALVNDRLVLTSWNMVGAVWRIVFQPSSVLFLFVRISVLCLCVCGVRRVVRVVDGPSALFTAVTAVSHSVPVILMTYAVSE